MQDANSQFAETNDQLILALRQKEESIEVSVLLFFHWQSLTQEADKAASLSRENQSLHEEVSKLQQEKKELSTRLNSVEEELKSRFTYIGGLMSSRIQESRMKELINKSTKVLKENVLIGSLFS